MKNTLFNEVKKFPVEKGIKPFVIWIWILYDDPMLNGKKYIISRLPRIKNKEEKRTRATENTEDQQQIDKISHK